MAIPNHIRANFETLLRAAENGDLGLIECRDAATGEPRYVIAAFAPDGEAVNITPFGHMAEGNPFDTYVPPLED
jgi:hypothetical protein